MSEIDELTEVKNELRKMGDEFLLSVGGSESAGDIIEVIGKHMFKLNQFAEQTFAVDKPEPKPQSRIILP
jgi:hypothetical protein